MTQSFGFDPDMASTAAVDFGITRDGLSQLRRCWHAQAPRAVLVLVHGIAEHSGRYEHVARQFVDAGVTVIAYDQRGFGDSGGRRGHVDSFDQFHDDVEDHLAEARKLDLPTILLGHSMGGLICAGYALTGRPQPDKVVLSAPALAFPASRWLLTPVEVLGRLLPGVSVKLQLKGEDLASDPRVGEKYMADPLLQLENTLGLLGAMIRSIRRVGEDLWSWSSDSLVIHGLDDKIVLPAASEAIGECAGVDRRTYDGLRHEIFNEPTGPSVVAEILDWLG